MTAVIAAAVEGAKIVDLCALGDGLIVDEAKKVFNKGNVAKGKKIEF